MLSFAFATLITLPSLLVSCVSVCVSVSEAGIKVEYHVDPH